MAVSDDEYAMLSNAVYHDDNYINPENYGFNRVDCQSYPDHGFYCEAYQRGNDVVVVFRGSDNLKNFGHDLDWAVLGIKPPELNDAIAFYNNIKRQFPGSILSMTGHSIGGSCVQYVDAKLTTEYGYQVDGAAFAPAGVGGLFPKVDPSSIHVRNYARDSDIVPGGMNKQLGYEMHSLEATTKRYEVQYTNGVGEIVSYLDDGKLAQHRILGYWVDVGHLQTRSANAAEENRQAIEDAARRGYNDAHMRGEIPFGGDAVDKALLSWRNDHPEEAKRLDEVVAEASAAMPKDANGNVIIDPTIQNTYKEKIEKAIQDSSLSQYIDKAAASAQSNQDSKHKVNAEVTQLVSGNAVRQVISKYKQNLSGEEEELKCLIASPPLTRQEAKQKAVSDYTKGYSKALDEERRRVESSMKFCERNEALLQGESNRLGIKKYLPGFMLDAHDKNRVAEFERDTAKVQSQSADLTKTVDAYNNKLEQLNQQLGTPEAKEFINKRQQEYLDKDQERLAQRSGYQARLTEIKTEKESINKLEKVLPDAMRGASIEIAGDATDPQNVLAQTENIALQTAPVLQQQMQYKACQGLGRGR